MHPNSVPRAKRHHSMCCCLDCFASFICWWDTQSVWVLASKFSELYKASSFLLLPHKAFKRTRQIVHRNQAAAASTHSSNEWQAWIIHHVVFCILNLVCIMELLSFFSLCIARLCMFVIYSPLTTLQGLHWGTVNVTYLLSQMNLSCKRAVPMTVLLFLICNVLSEWTCVMLRNHSETHSQTWVVPVSFFSFTERNSFTVRCWVFGNQHLQNMIISKLHFINIIHTKTSKNDSLLFYLGLCARRQLDL